MAQETLEGSRPGGIPRQTGPSPAAPIDAIESTLRDFLAAQIGPFDTVDPALGGFARTTRDLVMAGGKRLRPTFAYWGWRGVVGPTEPVEPVLPALGSLELMHTFALVHDDVMDESATRRGRPTAHRIFAGQHSDEARRGDSDRFGATAAILVGDLCLIWADQLLARTSLSTATLFAVRAGYDRMRIEAVAGQYLDVLGESAPATWSLERALLVAHNKTASYTVLRPLQFGTALAGLIQPEVDNAYRVYGAAVGAAFQLRDDLLGVYGDPAVTGKPAGDDLRSGKPTALLMLAHQLATPAQRAELALDPAGAVIPADGSGGPTSAQIARRAEVITETGAPARVEEMISERVEKGVAALADAPIHADARAALTDLAVRATHRPA
ncbi:polyprenyl synthetase family protein [Micromonosporaceae bacterium Da 78-11]